MDSGRYSLAIVAVALLALIGPSGCRSANGGGPELTPHSVDPIPLEEIGDLPGGPVHIQIARIPDQLVLLQSGWRFSGHSVTRHSQYLNPRRWAAFFVSDLREELGRRGVTLDRSSSRRAEVLLHSFTLEENSMLYPSFGLRVSPMDGGFLTEHRISGHRTGFESMQRAFENALYEAKVALLTDPAFLKFLDASPERR